MPTSTRRAFTSVALVLVADEDPKARMVDGTPDQSEITEELGVFVAVDGKPGGTSKTGGARTRIEDPSISAMPADISKNIVALTANAYGVAP